MVVWGVEILGGAESNRHREIATGANAVPLNRQAEERRKVVRTRGQEMGYQMSGGRRDVRSMKTWRRGSENCYEHEGEEAPECTQSGPQTDSINSRESQKVDSYSPNPAATSAQVDAANPNAQRAKPKNKYTVYHLTLSITPTHPIYNTPIPSINICAPRRQNISV